jgi:SAM-dependent methyltransferase
MAARENEVWGKILPDLERSEARIEDSEASAKLGVARYTSSLLRVARERNLKFENGLTLGCGAGRCERELVGRGVCRSFHGIDISEKAIATAREIAKEKDLPLTYEVADLNGRGSDFASSRPFSRARRGTSMAFAEERWLSLDS